ncbi:MAG: hypothetical protein K1X88_03875 [Nannocystaceae bacterium]|nr:hypothetical protein [Nannocystaceae bacterium]
MPRARLVHAAYSTTVFALACGVDAPGGGAFGSTSDASTTSAAGSRDTGDDADAGSAGEGHADGSDDAAKFDVGDDTTPDTPCGCGSSTGRSAIWISLSNDGVVAKLDTDTLVEAARYVTRSDGAGDPSRTSVSLGGSKAAVANRNGGVAAFWTDPASCDPMANGEPGLQTSTGKDDILPFGADDCLAWSRDFAYTSQRPIAWAPGELDEATCTYHDEVVWTSGCSSTEPEVHVHLLDGDDGSSLVDRTVPGFPCQGLGAYGGAADAEGNFWISNKQPNGGQSLLARIDRETYEVQVWPAPVVAYGITVDAQGRVWVSASLGDNSGALPELGGAASAARFDPPTETWALVNNHVARGEGGIQQGPDGRMWMTFWLGFDATAAKGIAWIDPITLQMSEPFEIQPDDLGAGNNVWYPNGISIDHEGRIWVVAIGGTATRYDPVTEEIANYAELGWAYTYSDMTGWGLQNAACTPAG